jgi:hypothetical protein
MRLVYLVQKVVEYSLNRKLKRDNAVKSSALAPPSSLLTHIPMLRAMNKKIIFLLSLLFFASSSLADDIKSFTSDGCSAFPDGTLKQKKLWLACCTAHDLSYWQGGTYKERVKADQELKYCVAKVGEPTVAALMLAGVRVGGTPYFPTSFRWGYGWPYPRGYKAVTPEEYESIKAMPK